MAREKRMDTAAVGSVTLKFDLNRIEGEALLKVQSTTSQSVEVYVPVVDIIGAIAKMGNAYMAETAKLLAPESDQLDGDSEDCTIPEHTHTAAQRRRLRTTEEPKVTALEARENAARYEQKAVDGLSALGPVSAAPRRLGLSPEEEAEGK